MIDIRDLHAGYGSAEIVRGVTISAQAGEVISLVGRNGVGKTTTLKALIGLARVFRGSISFNERAYSNGPTPVQACRNGVGYVAQNQDVCPGLTVEENLLLPLYANALSPRGTIEIYARFQRLFERRKQLAGSLSGGERKLLAFARIMLLKPTVYLVDEPTEGLMPQAVDDIARLLMELSGAGACVLLIEQDLSIIRQLSDRIYFMNNGRIEADADRLDDVLVSRFLGV
jgi:branched-chain amino acid transport system ATP-binding protein